MIEREARGRMPNSGQTDSHCKTLNEADKALHRCQLLLVAGTSAYIMVFKWPDMLSLSLCFSIHELMLRSLQRVLFKLKSRLADAYCEHEEGQMNFM
jgi:hypothetical protein